MEIYNSTKGILDLKKDLNKEVVIELNHYKLDDNIIGFKNGDKNLFKSNLRNAVLYVRDHNYYKVVCNNEIIDFFEILLISMNKNDYTKDEILEITK